MLEQGQRVECTDKSSTHNGKQGTFEGYISNGLKVKFDDGREGLFLADALKKLK